MSNGCPSGLKRKTDFEIPHIEYIICFLECIICQCPDLRLTKIFSALDIKIADQNNSDFYFSFRRVIKRASLWDAFFASTPWNQSWASGVLSARSPRRRLVGGVPSRKICAPSKLLLVLTLALKQTLNRHVDVDTEVTCIRDKRVGIGSQTRVTPKCINHGYPEESEGKLHMQIYIFLCFI